MVVMHDDDESLRTPSGLHSHEHHLKSGAEDSASQNSSLSQSIKRIFSQGLARGAGFLSSGSREGTKNVAIRNPIENPSPSDPPKRSNTKQTWKNKDNAKT